MSEGASRPDDAALRASMRDYQGGALDAFHEVYGALAPPLRRYLRYLARDADRAEDLLQETFLQMHRSRASYNPAYPVAPWAFGLARYVFPMHRRAARRFAAVHDPRETLPEVPVPAEMEALATTDAVRRAMAALSVEQSEPLVLHHVWGFAFGEIAGMLGISPAAARARSSRGMAELRRVLESERQTS
jgi:RNA polymerase sigma-70 factor (ECF subfamily)